MKAANYEFVEKECDENTLIIRDLGPWDTYWTITNAAEDVVRGLAEHGNLGDDRRLFYYDSDGQLSELKHKNGRFVGFAPATPMVK